MMALAFSNRVGKVGGSISGGDIVEIQPLSGALGAEVLGADIRRESTFDAILQAFTDHSVIVLRRRP